MSDALFRVYDLDYVGLDGYPAEWHQTIKHLVREAAGHRCVRCGHPYQKGDGEWSDCDEWCTHKGPIRILNRFATENLGRGPVWDEGAKIDALGAAHFAVTTQSVQARWRILTVHHLNGHKEDCRWWNLVSLCQRCHLRVQRVVLMERVWPWEHSEWFKPYVAGYYASVYLGEEITREQAVSRMNELLALERVA